VAHHSTLDLGFIATAAANPILLHLGLHMPGGSALPFLRAAFAEAKEARDSSPARAAGGSHLAGPSCTNREEAGGWR